jgi:hypothetical protein
MLHFQVNAEKEVVAVATDYPQDNRHWASNSADGSGWMTRHDIKSVEQAAEIAESAQNVTGKTYLPVDSGSGVWPRFDVIEAPAVGDDVSYAFNGDYYPCGQIASISASFRLITTTEGQKFYRRKQTANWKYNGVWSLVDGHRSELNPSF